MRTFLAAAAGLVAFVAALVTVPALWMSSHVADEDGYVAFSSTLATDDELQGAFAAYLSNEFAGRGLIPSSLEPVATAAFRQVAGRTSDLPGFVDAWEQTQRNFHRAAFDEGAPQTLTVDVSPMAAFLVERVSDQLPVKLRAPDELVVPVVRDTQDQQAIDRARQVADAGTAGLVVSVLAALAAVALARRRSVAVAWLGVGAVVAAGVLKLASSTVAQAVLDRADAPSEFARTLQKLLVDRAADSLSGWLVWFAVVGALAAVAGLAGRAVGGRTSG